MQEAERFVEGYPLGFSYTYFINVLKKCNLGLCSMLLFSEQPLGFGPDCIWGLYYI